MLRRKNRTIESLDSDGPDGRPIDISAPLPLPVEMRIAIKQCQEPLSERQRAAVELSLDDLNLKEIGEILGISSAAVWGLNHRAVKHLLECLKARIVPRQWPENQNA